MNINSLTTKIEFSLQPGRGKTNVILYHYSIAVSGLGIHFTLKRFSPFNFITYKSYIA